MGRKVKMNVETLEIGQKMAFPKSKNKYVYQYLNNFHNRLKDRKFKKVDKGVQIFIERVS